MRTLEEHLVTKPIEDPHSRAMLNTMFTGVWLQQKMMHILKPYDITEPQYNVLRILRGQDGNAMNLYEIQNRMIQKMSNVSRLIDKLVAKKLVTREECSDNRRRVDIAITDDGMQILEQVAPHIEDYQQNIINSLTTEEAKTLGHLLDKMRNE